MAPAAAYRDLFQFGSMGVQNLHRPQNTITDGIAAAAPHPASHMQLKLIGIATANDVGIVRTAIVSAPEVLYLVTQGESLGSQYVVETITDAAVDLHDVTTGETRRLALR